MEEILASIRRIIADDQETARSVEAPPPPPPQPPEPDDEDEVLDLAEIAAPAPPRQTPNLELEHEDISFRDSDDFDAIGADEAAPGRDEPEPPPARYEAPAQQEPPALDRLISPSTDASVGQAFNMLAHTVLTQNSRTLEDLVKDMLKPMLKIWLDDNLPGIVERLVRAEIERVARGGR